MKSTLFNFILILFSFQAFATVYTFHTEGNYTDVSNWDVYPGEILLANDTISIEANCTNILLSAYDGYVVFNENCTDIGINNLTIEDDCQLEFQASYFQLNLFGFFFYFTNNQIITPNFTFIDITNSGSGIDQYNCDIFDYDTNIFYYNYGSQESLFLECMEGQFSNSGTINVFGNHFDLNCDLDLSDGTIEGNVPYEISISNGTITQNCTSCTATIDNVNNIYLSTDTNIQGMVIINGPE